jgi:hypothetical protein
MKTVGIAMVLMVAVRTRALAIDVLFGQQAWLKAAQILLGYRDPYLPYPYGRTAAAVLEDLKEPKLIVAHPCGKMPGFGKLASGVRKPGTLMVPCTSYSNQQRKESKVRSTMLPERPIRALPM